jgi:hypothetical protein
VRSNYDDIVERLFVGAPFQIMTNGIAQNPIHRPSIEQNKKMVKYNHFHMQMDCRDALLEMAQIEYCS